MLSVPIVVMSASAESDVIRGLERKGTHLLDKPLDLDHLTMMIKTILSLKDKPEFH